MHKHQEKRGVHDCVFDSDSIELGCTRTAVSVTPQFMQYDSDFETKHKCVAVVGFLSVVIVGRWRNAYFYATVCMLKSLA